MLTMSIPPVFRYMIKRLIISVLTIFVVLIINFLVPRLSPLNPIEGIISRMTSVSGVVQSEELVKEYERLFGLDKDLATQFFCYLREVMRGNLGYSITHFPAKVEDLIMRALPWTLFLVGLSSAISWTLGTILGVFVGWKGVKSKSNFIIPAALALSIMPYYMLASSLSLPICLFASFIPCHWSL